MMISVNNFSLKYQSININILNNIFFDVKEGELVVILGKSGLGKTTLLNAIGGVFREKEVIMEGTINFLIPKPRIRMVFQNHNLLSWLTVFENLSIGLEEIEKDKELLIKKLNDALKMVGLEKFKDYYPSQLSIGMQQRINLIRAVICDPDILLLDEPFSSLDSKTKKNLYKYFQEIRSRKKFTTILVTHNKNEANLLADKIYDLNLKKFI